MYRVPKQAESYSLPAAWRSIQIFWDAEFFYTEEKRRAATSQAEINDLLYLHDVPQACQGDTQFDLRPKYWRFKSKLGFLGIDSDQFAKVGLETRLTWDSQADTPVRPAARVSHADMSPREFEGGKRRSPMLTLPATPLHDELYLNARVIYE